MLDTLRVTLDSWRRPWVPYVVRSIHDTYIISIKTYSDQIYVIGLDHNHYFLISLIFKSFYDTTRKHRHLVSVWSAWEGALNASAPMKTGESSMPKEPMSERSVKLFSDSSSQNNNNS